MTVEITQTNPPSQAHQGTAVTGRGGGERFVAERVIEGVDYIKIIVENPAIMGAAALTGPTIAALVQAAHKAPT